MSCLFQVKYTVHIKFILLIAALRLGFQIFYLVAATSSFQSMFKYSNNERRFMAQNMFCVRYFALLKSYQPVQ